MKLTGGNVSTRGKTCPCATSSTTNSTWTDLGSNPGLRGERSATNRLSHATANQSINQSIYLSIYLCLLSMSVCLSVHPSIHPHIHLSVRPFAHLSVCLPACLRV